MSIETILTIVALVAAAFIVITIYNSMVKKDKQATEAWHGIDVQLKRRYDLIPNLVETVKGYAQHESSTLEKLVSLRNQMGSSQTLNEQVENQTALTGMLRQVFALSENYPDLKANQNFADMQQSLEQIEDTLQDARRYYNATVRDFNTYIAYFPINLLAALFRFKEKPFFEISDSKERDNVQVRF